MSIPPMCADIHDPIVTISVGAHKDRISFLFVYILRATTCVLVREHVYIRSSILCCKLWSGKEGKYMMYFFPVNCL